MEREKIKKQVFKLLCDTAMDIKPSLSKEDFTFRASLKDDLGLDSLDIMDLVYQMEKKLELPTNTQLEEKQFNDSHLTVGDIVEIFAHCMAAG